MKLSNLFPGAMILVFSFTGYPSVAQNFTPARTFGEENLIQDFLCSEVDYPGEALAEGKEGTVILSFTVTEKGQVSDLQVKQSVNPQIDAEAIRMFRMLLWEPAVRLGNPVSSVSEFQVKFDIKKYKKHCKARGYDKTVFPYEPIDSSQVVYEAERVDKPPAAIFPDKGMTLGKFINENIKYPETAFRQSISGKVALRFVVEKHGRVSNIKVMQPVSGGCTQEAIRLLERIKWMPGIKDDMAVRTFMNLEINFKLPEDSDLKMFENQQMNSN
jgi:TonB family protein